MPLCDYMSGSNEFHVLGKKGLNLSSQLFNQEVKKSDLSDPALINIFDAYNKNRDEKLDSDELSVLFNDIKNALKTANGGNQDKILDPAEIQKLLKSKNLDKKLSIGDVLNFLDALEVKNKANNLNGLSCNDKTKSEISSIQTQNVADVLSKYASIHGESILQTMANDRWSRGSTRETFMKTVKDKLVENAKLMGIDTKDFETKFDKELKTIDMTLLSTYDTKKLDTLVNNLVKQIQSKKSHYQKNRNGIVTMMADPKECWNKKDDKYELMNLIYQDAVTYTPEKMLKSIKKDTDNPKIKQMISKLQNSKYLEYYPIYVASIIAQESQFRTNDSAIFTQNGQGIMQLTKNRISDIYNNPFLYDDDYTDELVESFELEEELYSAVRDDRSNVELNLFVGNIALGGIMHTALRRMKNGSIPPSINMNSPEAFMQFVAMSYNGNDAAKKDPKFNNKMSQVRYIYGRDVIQRFKKYTPSDIQVNRYFEYNPDKKDFVNH